MTDAPFVLVTHHGTMVCADPKDGRLIHRPLETCTPNLTFKWEDGKLALSSAFEPPAASSNTSALIERMPLEVEFTPDRLKFAMRMDGKFACAQDDDGTVTFSRTSASAWEQFSELNIIEFYEAKIKSLDRLSTPRMRLPRKQAIPQIVHQIFISDNLPDNISRNIEKLKALNPGWEYRLWTDKDTHDAIYEWYGFATLELYLKINPKYGAAKADLFRYLCIYKLGGVYLDIKSGSSVAFGDILTSADQFILSQWNNLPGETFPNSGLHAALEHIPGGEYQQWHVIAAPGHPFLEHVIQDVLCNIAHYDRDVHRVGKIGVLNVTGPIAYSLAIQKIIGLYPHRIIDSEKAGLIYNAAGARPTAFATHYSKLEENIIL
jgi:hypothetical protein